MKDLIITINANTRKPKLTKNFLGINGENLQGNIIVDFEDEFIDGTCYFEVDDGNEKYLITMEKVENHYIVPIKSSLLTSVVKLSCQIHITLVVGEEEVAVFKSEVFEIPVLKAINASETIPDEYPTFVDEITTRVEDLEENKQNNLIAGDNITLQDNEDGTTTINAVSSGSGISQSEVINRPNAIPSASASSPDFVQVSEKLYQKKVSGSPATYSYEEVGSGSVEGLPLGFIFASVLPQSNLNYHLLNGDSLAISSYGDFYTLLTTLVGQNYSLTCTVNEYAEDIDKTGNCGKFVINTTSSDVTGTYGSTTITVTANSFKLPTITRFIQGIESLANLGESLEAGLPNITGNSGIYRFRAGTVTHTGAITYINEGSTSPANYTNDTANGGYIGINASLSNSIYGNSTTVQPEATMYPYYIVVKNNSTTGVMNYLQELAQAGVQSLGGSVGAITLGDCLKIVNNELNIVRDLLWENQYPDVSMGTQTVTLNKHALNYNFLLICYKYNCLKENGYMVEIITPINNGYYELKEYRNGQTLLSRYFTYDSTNNSISFQDCLNSSGQSESQWVLPVKIYGIN